MEISSVFMNQLCFSIADIMWRMFLIVEIISLLRKQLTSFLLQISNVEGAFTCGA